MSNRFSAVFSSQRHTSRSPLQLRRTNLNCNTITTVKETMKKREIMKSHRKLHTKKRHLQYHSGFQKKKKLNPNMPLSFYTSTSTSLASSALHSDIPQETELCTEDICCPLQVTFTTEATHYCSIRPNHPSTTKI